VAARLLPAGLLCWRPRPLPLSALQGRQPTAQAGRGPGAVKRLVAEPLTRATFAEFGAVLDTDWADHHPINDGRCERYHALATADAQGPNGRVVLSMFRGTPYASPLKLPMVERHPLGSQAFMPLMPRPFL